MEQNQNTSKSGKNDLKDNITPIKLFTKNANQGY
jgi:hypothetical protein